MTGNDPLLQLVGVSRGFPGVLALDRVDFDLRRGELHALVGENGAGKSTLIKLISGALAPSAGEIFFQGRRVRFDSPMGARRMGIVAVHQEAEIFGPLSVAENMAMESGLPTRGGFVAWNEVFATAQAAAERLPAGLDVRQIAERLTLGQRHMTQIAAAVVRSAQILLLDEPTSALSQVESEWLFRELAQRKEAGVGIIYISHRQEEIFRLADRITVLRDGRRVWSGPPSQTDPAGLVQAMVGRQTDLAPSQESKLAATANAETRFAARGISDAAGRVRNASFAIARGEIVGMYGLIGAGRSELAQLLFGLRERRLGAIEVDGKSVEIRNPQDAVRAGIAYLPEDRLHEGIFRGLSIRANAVLARLFKQRHAWVWASVERRSTERQIAALGVNCRSAEQPIGQLSGGNQQKVVLARWLLTEPAVLLLDEPTRGIDVAAKAEIHRLIGKLAAGGCAVLLVSSDLPEVLAHSDRLLVFRQGTVVGEFDPATARPEAIAAAALPESEGTPSPVAAARTRSWPGWSSQRLWPLAMAVLLLAGALGASAPHTLTLAAWRGQLLNASVWVILSLASSAVLIVGGIDISIGALFALAGVTAGLILKSGGSPAATIPLAVLAGLGVGALGGLVNATLVLAGRIHPIVVTLGALSIYRGLLVSLTGGNQISGLPEEFGRLGTGTWLGLHGASWMAIATAIALHVWLSRHRAGRHWYATGANPQAAALAGISRTRAWLGAFAAGGALAALAGLVELSTTGSIQSVSGSGYELRAIAAAVIGGVAVSGGRGSVIGVLLGVALLTLVDTAGVAWRLSSHYKQLVTGGLILLAVVLDWLGRRRSE